MLDAITSGDSRNSLIPGFLVPLYLLTHLAIFSRLARRRAGWGDVRLSGGV